MTPDSQAPPSSRWGVAVVVSAFIASVGLFVHNVADLPGQTILSFESSIPILITAVLVVAWFTRARRGVTWVLLGWGLLHLVGGAYLACCHCHSCHSSPSNR